MTDEHDRPQPSAKSPDTDWYIAQLKPNGLKTAVRNLAQQGYETFVPLLETTVQRRGIFTLQQKPLFAGYIFIRVAPEAAHWRTVNSTYGVSRIVQFDRDGAPRAIPALLMRALKSRCSAAGVLHPVADFAVGDSVRIIQGPFAEFVATISRLSSKERVWVLMDVLGRETEVAVRTDHLDATESKF